MDLNTVSVVSQTLSCGWLAYGAHRYLRHLNLDTCTSCNLNLGLAAAVVSSSTMLVSKLWR